MNRHTYICVTCRTVSRARHTGDVANIGSATCPTCRKPMRNMGHDWRPPKQRDDAAWKRIQAGDIWTEMTARAGDRPNAFRIRWVKGRILYKDVREPR